MPSIRKPFGPRGTRYTPEGVIVGRGGPSYPEITTPSPPPAPTPPKSEEPKKKPGETQREFLTRLSEKAIQKGTEQAVKEARAKGHEVIVPTPIQRYAREVAEVYKQNLQSRQQFEKQKTVFAQEQAEMHRRDLEQRREYYKQGTEFFDIRVGAGFYGLAQRRLVDEAKPGKPAEGRLKRVVRLRPPKQKEKLFKTETIDVSFYERTGKPPPKSREAWRIPVPRDVLSTARTESEGFLEKISKKIDRLGKWGYAKEVGKGIVKFPVQYGKGLLEAAKIGDPLYMGTLSKKEREIQLAKIKEPEFKTFAYGTAFLVGAKTGIGAKVAPWVRRGFGVLTGAQFVKEPTGEKLGETLFMFGPDILKPVPKPKIVTLKIPTLEGEKTVFRGISLELGPRGKPLLGFRSATYISPGQRLGARITLGTPRVGLSGADLSKGFIVESPSETAIIQKSIKGFYDAPEVSKLTGGLAIMRVTETTTSKFIQKQFKKDIETLSPRGVDEILKWSREYKGQVYGSFAARQQMPPDLARRPADIDIQFKSDAATAERNAAILVQRLLKVGEPVRISETTPTLIESRRGRGKTYRHAVDIHSLEQAEQEALSPAIATEKAYGLQMGQKTMKREGIEMMRLSEQGIRKGASIFTMRELGFGPEAHRMKDIPDWFAVQETLIRSKLFGRGRLLRGLEKQRALYEPELFGERGRARVRLDKPSKARRRDYPSIAGAYPPSYPFISPGRSISPSPWRSPSPSISPSISKSLSLSRSVSRSISKSVSSSISASRSMSNSVSRSISQSISSSISTSISTSRSTTRSVSRSISSSIGTSPSTGITSAPRSIIRYPPSEPRGRGRRPTGFNVFVKRKKAKIGKKRYSGRGYKQANKEPLSRQNAKILGARIVDKYTNRSFFIRPTYRKKRALDAPMGSWGVFAHKFRSSKKRPNRFVEKSMFAIDSFEEKQGIPFEAARQRKKGIL